ncbi:MAG: TonB-dependent receptor plug domain-containing protein [bacterium]|nr:TonB-dependent receptor plug domain-containing protein [bacterium]
MLIRLYRICLLSALCLLALPAAARVWTIEGEALRQRHYDTLEDCLREVPFIRVERYGASGLPFRVMSGGSTPEELLLVVDGMPWRDHWRGENLYEELPMSLLAKIEVDPEPACIEFGASAIGGVIRITTRRREEASVQTRLHLTQGPFDERTRRLSYETPPGEVGVAVGLDEFIGDGYPFSFYWGGPDSPVSAQPQIRNSDRRSLAVRLDLDFGDWGPFSCALVQSEWHMDTYNSDPSYNILRNSLILDAQLPATPVGAIRMQQIQIEKRIPGWLARDMGISLRWDSPRMAQGDTGLKISAGGERHMLGLSQGAPSELPRPSRAWLSADLDGSLPGALEYQVGGRCDARLELRRLLRYRARLGWPVGGRSFQLRLFTSAGDSEAPWNRDRLADFSDWPAGFSTPDTTSYLTEGRRTGLGLSLNRGVVSADLYVFREEGGSLWTCRRSGVFALEWQQTDRDPAHALGFDLGGRMHGRLGTVDTQLSLLAELEERRSPGVDAEQGEIALDLSRTYPWAGSWRLHLSRPLFETDARFGLGATLEYRGGLVDLRSMWRVNLEGELRIIKARFWVKLENALDWAGEEIVSFPVPPVSFRMGFDWHLDH